MKDTQAKIHALFTSTPTQMAGLKQKFTSYVKKQNTNIQVKKEAINNNQIYNTIHHGGDDRVIHQFNLETYDLLKKEFPHVGNLFTPSSLSENICVEGPLNEHTLCIGDTVKIGKEVILQVSEPRKPCITIDTYFKQVGVMKYLLQTLSTGLFYRVLSAGTINQNDQIELVDRISPNWSVAKVLDLTIRNKTDSKSLRQEIKNIKGLSKLYIQFAKL